LPKSPASMAGPFASRHFSDRSSSSSRIERRDVAGASNVAQSSDGTSGHVTPFSPVSSITCWNVGRFCHGIGSTSTRPTGENWIFSASSSTSHVEESAENCDSSDATASSSASVSAVRHAAASPPPQYSRENAPATGRPSTLRRSLSSCPYQPPQYELPPGSAGEFCSSGTSSNAPPSAGPNTFESTCGHHASISA